MELFFKRTFITTLLLLLLTLHPVHLQTTTESSVDPTDTPTSSGGKQMPPGWLRNKKPKLPIILPKEDDGAATDDPNDLKPMQGEDPPTDDTNNLHLKPMDSKDPSTGDLQPMESEDPSTDDSNGLQTQDGSWTDDQSGNGVASGSMFFGEPTEDPTQPSIYQNDTILASESEDFNVSSTTQSPNGEASVTDADTPNNDTVLDRVEEIAQNSTSSISVTEVETTTPAPVTNATEPSDAGSGEGFTEKTNSTAAPPLPKTTHHHHHHHSSTTSTVLVQETTKEESTGEEQETTETPIVPKETTTEPPETTSIVTSVPAITERANQSDKVAAPSGGTAERGFGSESERRQRKSAWGAVLGTFVAIAVVGLVAYVILKKKHQKAFNHRKLEEDFPSDPVLRLDNSEPLDLNFGRAAYYNPGLQGDNIQMSPYPKN